MRRFYLFSGVISFIILTIASCDYKPRHDGRNLYFSENELIHSSAFKDSCFIKAHDFDGNVYIFKNHWQIDTLQHIISGQANLFNAQRELVESGMLSVSTDNIVIFETNRILVDETSGLIAPKVVLSAFNVILAGICISSPKVCFGSCPTFYTYNQDHVFETVAESFSNAILPSLQYNDIDDIKTTVNGGSDFALTMKNEALETHYVQAADILVIPKVKEFEQIMHGNDDKFYYTNLLAECSDIYSQYDIKKEDIIKRDHHEWTSLANPEHLSTKGEIILTFDDVNPLQAENLGISMTFRQTLMTTYLLYHGLSYMGDEYSDMLTVIETSKRKKEKATQSILHHLGKIDLYWNTSQSAEGWKYAGSFYETGPIAKNSQVCPIQNIVLKNKGPVYIKIVFNEGLWKFDEISLVSVKEVKNAAKIPPAIVFKTSDLSVSSNDMSKKITFPLTSWPGDEYKIHYNIPQEHEKYQVFLSAEGYYLEWMRSEWLQDKNLKKLTQLLLDPESWLKAETENYKRYESQMEEEFENSKITSENKKMLLLISKTNEKQ